MNYTIQLKSARFVAADGKNGKPSLLPSDGIQKNTSLFIAPSHCYSSLLLCLVRFSDSKTRKTAITAAEKHFRPIKLEIHCHSKVSENDQCQPKYNKKKEKETSKPFRFVSIRMYGSVGAVMCGISKVRKEKQVMEDKNNRNRSS